MYSSVLRELARTDFVLLARKDQFFDILPRCLCDEPSVIKETVRTVNLLEVSMILFQRFHKSEITQFEINEEWV